MGRGNPSFKGQRPSVDFAVEASGFTILYVSHEAANGML